jgi:Plasmid pRiA4b ORF-3-like protein
MRRISELLPYAGGMKDSLVRICVTLHDVDPAIWRRIEVPANFTLEDLHDCPASHHRLGRLSSASLLLDIAPRDLPMIWNADFMLGPSGADGTDSYVLGEIDVSSVFPFSDEVPAQIAGRVADRLRSKL